jgi:hypothetical protein
VLPQMADPQIPLCGDDRNVVFFFAKQTLSRVLELTAKDTDAHTFVERWMCGDAKSQLSQEYLANGDIIVRLRIVGAECWR